ncbi:MAG: peptide ABC transporter substrate-binding protein [Halobacteriovorax sp.]|nr:peptide ABC transporter substrate-binding protein [Halobacteriovorax sp.]|tara:strand:- start:22328 stop:23959 length:1632 start_codon:yes stop_codon:yes gene_type:complete
MNPKFILVLFISLFLTASAFGALGNPSAPKGGTFKYNLEVQPPTLNALSSSDYYASVVQGYVMEGLLTRNADTREWEPGLAEKWDISKDGLVYTFTLRDGVKWHDGKPLTIEDVKFSFDAIMHPKDKYKTARLKPYYENIKDAVVVDKKTIKFNAKKVYFRNFDVVAGLTVVPKHLYENPNKKQKKLLNKTLIGTGPFILDKFKRGKSITLKRNKNWWGNTQPHTANEYKYDKILMRFVKETTAGLRRLEKGQLDFQEMGAEHYMKNTKGKKWGKSVYKVKIQNKAAKGYGFIGWNLRDDILKDKNVRLGLYHLLDREKMIKKFRYDMAEPATGPVYRKSVYANLDVKPILYDFEKAKALFKKSGWADTDGDQILDKVINGNKTKLSITILEPNKEFVKYLTMYKEDAKKAGVDINVKLIEWNAFLKLLDERKFQAVRLGWGAGSVDWDPKQIWHSASQKGGSNFIGYKNAEVDKLIDEARTLIDFKKRQKVLRRVFKLIADDVPYAFFFNDKYGFYGHTKRMKREKDTYSYNVGISYWWIQK